MNTAQITDHTVRALKRLLEQYKGKVKINKDVSIDADRTQMLENMLFDLFARLPLDVATGTTLDLWGDMVGLARAGVSDDDEYRAGIKVRIIQNTCNGEPDSIILILQLLYNPSFVEFNEYSAAFGVVFDPAIPVAALKVFKQLRMIKAAGVKVAYVARVTNQTGFCFAGSNATIGSNTGFASVDNPDAGGGFAGMI